MTTIIIVESAIIIALLLIAFVIGSNSTLISKKQYVRINEALDIANKNLKECTRQMKLKDVQIEFLKVAKNELYEKIHNKPHDSKGKFCRKEDAVNGTAN
jgi:uncharacterized protein YoxC